MTDLRLILHITRTHLLSRIRQSGVAALGVTFGIGAYIILMGFMTGLNEMLDGLILNRTPHVHVFNEIKPSEKQPIDLYSGLEEAIRIVHSVKPKQNIVRIHNALPIIDKLSRDERVLGVTPQVAANAFYISGSNELNGLISGIDVQSEMRLFNFGDYITRGDPLSLLKVNNGILLGAGIADKMSISIGDGIQVAAAGGAAIPLKVVGIFQSGLAEVDDVQSYVSLPTAQQILGEGSNFISDINVKLYDIDQSPALAAEIREYFDVSAIDIRTANAQFDTGSSIRNLITYAVSIALLIVAGFGIYNILNMLIYEKMNDIAILKATGFTGYDVKLIFVSQAVIIGLVGGLLGLGVGYGVSVLIDNTAFETSALPTIDTYPVNYHVRFYLVGMIFALVSTFMAGYLPATRAQRIDPVEIIRQR